MSKTLTALAAAAFLSPAISFTEGFYSPDTLPSSSSNKGISIYANQSSKPATEIPALRLVDSWNGSLSQNYYPGAGEIKKQHASPIMIFADPNGKRYPYNCQTLEKHLGITLAEMIQNEDKRTYRATQLQVDEFQRAKRLCPLNLI